MAHKMTHTPEQVEELRKADRRLTKAEIRSVDEANRQASLKAQPNQSTSTKFAAAASRIKHNASTRRYTGGSAKGKGKDSNDGHSFDAVDHGFLQAGSDTHAEAAKDGQSDIVHLMATNARSQKTDVHGYLKDAIDDYKGFGEDYKDLDSAKGPSILGKKMVNDSTGTSATQHGSGRRGGGRGRRSMKY